MNRVINSFLAVLFAVFGIVVVGPILIWFFKIMGKIIWPNCYQLNFPGPYLYYCQNDSVRTIYSAYMMIGIVGSFLMGLIIMIIVWTRFTKVVDRFVTR